MRLFIPLSLVFGSIVATAATDATISPASTVGVRSMPAFMARKDITEGVAVVEMDKSPEAQIAIAQQLEGTTPNPNLVARGHLERRNDCNGSGGCSLYLSKGDCQNAYNSYSDNTYYCGYHSRTSGNCAAIWTCSSFNGCMAGWWLKQQFANVYSIAGCGKCGTYRPGDGDAGNGCRATLNFCNSCNNV